MRRKSIAAIAAFAVVLGAGLVPGFVSTASAVHGGTPPAHMVDLIWANDRLWNTVVLGELHGNVPAHTLDAFYVIPGQNPVAESSPGDSDYNGGRWLPTVLAWVGPGTQPLFTDGEAVKAAIDGGSLVVMGTGNPFLCPLTNPNDTA